MAKLKKAFKRSFALVVAVVVSVVAFCFPAAAASSTLPVQTVGFDGISVSAINVSGTIQSMVVETNYRSCMLRFWPGSSAKVAFVISNPSFFRVRSGFKYHLKLRASLSGLAFKKIGVAFGIDGGNLMNLPAEDIHYDFTYTSNNAYAYFEQTSGIFQRDYTFSTVAFVFELTSAVSPFNFWLADFTVQEIDPNQEIVDGIGDKVDENTDKITGNTDPNVGGAGDKADELNDQIGDYNKKEDEVIDLLQTSTDDALLKYNPFKQLNFMALAVAFSGFTSTFNSIIASLGVHFSTVIAFSVCAGFFALIVGIVIRPGNRPPPKD